MNALGRGRRGVSIVELTVALAVLVVLIGAASTLSRQGAVGARVAEEEAIALAAARGLLAIQSRQAPAEDGAGTDLDIPFESARRLRGAKARATWHSWRPGLRSLEVELTWTGAFGTRRSVALTTLVRERRE